MPECFFSDTAARQRFIFVEGGTIIRTMKPKILLVNPPIYDFAAYDFWLRPYGLLRLAGRLRGQGEMSLFDYLDRGHPYYKDGRELKADAWGRGQFAAERIAKPAALKDIPRYFNRFGAEREVFRKYLVDNPGFDFVLIQTSLTYWYPGVREVIEDLRSLVPSAKIVLGGFYATCCTEHALSLGADLVVRYDELDEFRSLTGLTPADDWRPPAWELYPSLSAGVMTLTEGCPFRCSYCWQPLTGRPFRARPLEECIGDYEYLVSMGARNIAFYDDALLVNPEAALLGFLEHVIAHPRGVRFHTPNALHARMLTGPMAQLMVRAGFTSFYLGYESASEAFQQATGGKIISQDLADAVEALRAAGVGGEFITAYELLGHPKGDIQQVEQSMQFVHSLGIRVMLADFSPIPGTPDGELCRGLVDLDEPLNHNKTAFPIRLLGNEAVNRFKNLCRHLNGRLGSGG